MKIGIFGTGYVGLVTAAGFAEVGHEVICVDNNPALVQQLKDGQIPIHEPGLAESLKKSTESGNISFTTHPIIAIDFASVLFITVGTPAQADGSANLSYMNDVANTIGTVITGHKTIVVKSTVPVGTSRRIADIINLAITSRNTDATICVVSNPEFLKEGEALSDFRKPDRIIVGSTDANSIAVIKKLYESFSRNHEKIVLMTQESAELTKYASNAMLATRISFMNELSKISEKLGADIEDVRRGIGSDRRIGPDFLYAGAGFGGSCFPKDLAAISTMAKDAGVETPIIDAVQLINIQQKEILIRKASSYLGDLSGLTCAVWGLAFKPNTDDTRESPALQLVYSLMNSGAYVRAYDPIVKQIKNDGGHSKLTICANRLDAILGADVLFLATEWNEFKNVDFKHMGRVMKQKVIVDGRNLWNPVLCRSFGFKYIGIGRS